MASQTALVTGGTSAIGAAIVRRLVADGLSVHFTYATHARESETIAAETGAEPHHLDFERVWDPPRLDVDVLVNNAGVNLSGRSFLDDADDVLRRSLTVNVEGPVRLARTYAPRMAQRGFGRIVNINSIYGHRGPARRMSYVASKFALRGVTMSMALDLANSGVTVNEVCPGPVQTRMLDRMADAAVSEGRFRTISDYLESVAGDVPIGVLIAPDDIANAVSFFVRPESRAITGVSLPVDGGLLVR